MLKGEIDKTYIQSCVALETSQKRSKAKFQWKSIAILDIAIMYIIGIMGDKHFLEIKNRQIALRNIVND